jgi:hypothetical protein
MMLTNGLFLVDLSTPNHFPQLEMASKQTLDPNTCRFWVLWTFNVMTPETIDSILGTQKLQRTTRPVELCNPAIGGSPFQRESMVETTIGHGSKL